MSPSASIATRPGAATPSYERPALVRGQCVWAPAVVWCFRALLFVPFVLMAPEIVAALRHEPDAVADLTSSDADLLGTSTFLVFVLMLTVTPVAIVTGWRWHVVLRRDYGIAM